MILRKRLKRRPGNTASTVEAASVQLSVAAPIQTMDLELNDAAQLAADLANRQAALEDMAEVKPISTA